MPNLPVAKPIPLQRGWQFPRRGVLLLVLALGTIALAGVALASAWPEPDPSASVLADVDDFAPGSVTDFERQHVFLVRLDEGSFLALYDAATGHLNDPIEWRPEFEFQGIIGWFRSPFHGEAYDRHGNVRAGPAARGMDRFPVQVTGSRIEVDTEIAYCGGDDRGGTTPCDPSVQPEPIFARG